MYSRSSAFPKGIDTRVPPIQPKDGRNYVVDMEPLIFHLKEVFIVTSVISPDEARIKFERSLE